jgi:P pilus assembly chaperone PapD
MKKNLYIWPVSLLAVALMASQAQAIGISSMLEYADERGEATYTISNTDDYRQYINTAISEVSVVNGVLKNTPYTRNNIDIWALEVRPARTILEPGFKKNIMVKYQPKKGIERADRDRVFQLSFVPTPYFAEGEKPLQVKVAFGFAPLLIVPAKQPQPLKYEMVYRGDKVVVTNKGDTFFSLTLDGCGKNVPAKVRDACVSTATVLAGRTLNIELPKDVVGVPELKASMFSYGNKFKAQSTLVKQG